MTDDDGKLPPKPEPKPPRPVRPPEDRPEIWNALSAFNGKRVLQIAIVPLAIASAGFAGGVAYVHRAERLPVPPGGPNPPIPTTSSLDWDAATTVEPNADDSGAAWPPNLRPVDETDYVNRLASELTLCEPEAMLRYEATEPFWAYGNVVFRQEVVAVMGRRNFNGIRWVRAANGDRGVGLYRWRQSEDPTAAKWQGQRSQGVALPDSPPSGLSDLELARDRLVRMAVACVDRIHHDDALLGVDRYGAVLTLWSQTSPSPQH